VIQRDEDKDVERNEDKHREKNEDGDALEKGRKVERRREMIRFLVVLCLWCRGVKRKIRKKDTKIFTQPILRTDNTNAWHDKTNNRINGCY
jgi:hypothetical protein